MDYINVIIRIMPQGEEVEVELSGYTTGKEIIDELLQEDLSLGQNGSGELQVYELVKKDTNTKLEENRSLFDIGIKNGDILYLLPKMVAGVC